jgi:DNA-binding transcriptional regulator GbsR (MarR family)
MDRARAIFIDGIGAASATTGVLNQLQGRIFALLYLEPQALTLDDIARELEQSKSNVSVNIRALVEWHLLRRVVVGGSRKDHYEAATNLWRVMREIMERRFHWNLRQVLTTVEETTRAIEDQERSVGKTEAAFLQGRLEALRAFFAALDAGIGAFNSGKAFAAETHQDVVRLVSPSRRN